MYKHTTSLARQRPCPAEPFYDLHVHRTCTSVQGTRYKVRSRASRASNGYDVVVHVRCTMYKYYVQYTWKRSEAGEEERDRKREGGEKEKEKERGGRGKD